MAANLGLLKRPLNPTGVWGWLTTIDHKRIGILYGVTALILFFVAGIEAVIMRLQLASSDQTLVSPDVYNQLFTMHGTTMVFMVIMPMGAAFFNYLVPLMIGARDVAFPRLNAFSYWSFLFGALLMHASFITMSAPAVGWFAYSPLTDLQFAPDSGVDYWLLGLQILGVASMAAAFNFVVTIINLRAPGLTLMRMPVFVWMTLIISFLLIFAFPVITIALTLLQFDRWVETNFYNTAAGADPLLWQHLFWVFGHPEVYILILPAMGIVSDILPTFARKPLFGYPAVVFAGVAIAFMGFGVWSHHMFTTGMGAWANGVFAFATMLIAVPTGVKVLNWIATLWGGAIQFKTPLLFSIGFVSMFTLGGLSGVMHAIVPVDTQQQDTYFIVAHFHYVLFGGSLFGLMAGIYYWFPKMSGRMLHEGIGKLNFWLMFIGFNMTFFPMHIVGIYGMPRRIYTYPAEQGWDAINMFTTIGSFVIVASFLVFMINIFRSLRSGESAGDNPWNAPSIEWSISSPPPHYNFVEIPTIKSRYPLWEKDHSVGAAEAHGHSEEDGHNVHMPDPSFWPLVLSAGITLMAGGLLIWKWHQIFGFLVISIFGLIALYATYRWAFEPVNEPTEEGSQH